MSFTGRFFYVQGLKLEHYRFAFPNVDIVAELRLMDEWLRANPRRRKKNYDRFITNWLKAEERRARVTKAEQNVGNGYFENVKVRPEILERERQRNRR
jgi:hypothetical protein